VTTNAGWAPNLARFSRATLSVVIRTRVCHELMKKASVRQPLSMQPLLFPLSSREAVTFSIFSCFLPIQPAVFQAPDKAVILSEALRRSIANRGLYGAESKDPGDACWQMLLGAFRPQTTPEDNKVTNSEQEPRDLQFPNPKPTPRSRSAVLLTRYRGLTIPSPSRIVII
jgi:hypothetical protein